MLRPPSLPATPPGAKDAPPAAGPDQSAPAAGRRAGNTPSAPRRAAGALAAALGLHALVLILAPTGWPASGPPPGSPRTPIDSLPLAAPPVQARWLPALAAGRLPHDASSPPLGAIRSADADTARPLAPPTPSRQSVTPRASAARPAATGEPPPVVDPVTTQVPTPATGTATSQGRVEPPTAMHRAATDEPGADEYLPRHQLSRPPEAAAPVWIAYSEDAPLGRWEARLTLFIDETGQVRRVRPHDEGGLPPVLLDAAVQAFIGTRYTPGELGGQAVKSRIDVAVAFHGEALPRPVGLD